MSKIRLLAVISTLALLAFARPGFGQQKTQAAETLSHFLQTNLKSNLIVIEGDRYVDENKQDLAKILSDDTTPTTWDKVKAIADKCDYDAKQYEGAYLLYKRYSDARELPCVSSEELIAFSGDVAQAVKSLFPGRKEGDYFGTHLRDLLLSLPEADWQLAQRDILPVKELNAESQRNLSRLLTETFSGSLRTSSQLVDNFCSNTDDARLVLVETGDAPYFEYRVYRGGKPGNPWAVFPDHAPLSKLAVDKAISLNASYEGTQIQDLLKQINDTERKEGKKIVYASAKSLSHKPVSVVGLESAPPLHVLRGIAKLYDLRVVVSDKSVELMRKRFAPRPNVSLNQTIAASLPYPLRRALKVRNNKLSTAFVVRNYKPSAAFLISSLASKAQKEKTKSLAMEDLSDLYKTALVLHIFSDLAREIQDSDADRWSSHVSKVDALYLKYRRKPGNRLSFSMMSEKDGKLSEWPEYNASDVERK